MVSPSLGCNFQLSSPSLEGPSQIVPDVCLLDDPRIYQDDNKHQPSQAD